jgi:hypothetical protein
MPPLSLHGDWSPICVFLKIAIVDYQRATTLGIIIFPSNRRVKHFRLEAGEATEVPSPSILCLRCECDIPINSGVNIPVILQPIVSSLRP